MVLLPGMYKFRWRENLLTGSYRYIYYDADSQPTKEDLERSEMQEARLREGTFLVDRASLIRWSISSSTYALDRGLLTSNIYLSGFVRMRELLEMTRHEIVCIFLST